MKKSTSSILFSALLPAVNGYSIATYNRYVNAENNHAQPFEASNHPQQVETATSTGTFGTTTNSWDTPSSYLNEELGAATHSYMDYGADYSYGYSHDGSSMNSYYTGTDYSSNSYHDESAIHTPYSDHTDYTVGAYDAAVADTSYVASSYTDVEGQQMIVDYGGPVVGEKYVLASGEPRQSSGKSFIFDASLKDVQDGNRYGSQVVVVKLSSNTEAMEREAYNYHTITKGGADPQVEGLFVEFYDYMAEADPNCPKLKEHAALVMEKGGSDLQSYIKQYGRLEGWHLQYAAYSAAKCTEAIHKNNMVWTELKSSNFVLNLRSNDGTQGEVIKAIDLESVVPHSNPPIDYTAYAVPPEFALEFLCGREAQMPMDFSFDIWSLGMLFYEMATGSPYFKVDDSNVHIATTLKNSNGALDLDKNGDEWILDQDPDFKDLIQQCLNMNAESRPSIYDVLNHPYFYQSR